MEQNNALAREFHTVSLIKFALPNIGMMIFLSLYTIVDGMFISRLVGTTALSAINMSFPLNSLQMAIGIMLGTGGSAIIARRQGEGRAEQERAPEGAELSAEVNAHASAPEQTAQKTAGGAAGVLIEKRVDVAVDMELAAVEAELAEVQALAGDDERAGGGGHDDLVFVKALHIVHAGNGQALAPVQLDAVGGGAAVGRVVISHSKTSHTP